MAITLLKLSWIFLAIVCVIGFKKSLDMEESWITGYGRVPAWVQRRKWFFVLIFLMTFAMVVALSLAVARLDKTIDHATAGYEVHVVPAMPTVTHDAPSIQINFDNGKASWYDYCLPREKASTDPCSWSKTHATAASTKYARGDKLDVCVNDGSGRCVTVVVNDYGPDNKLFPNRIIDLSSYAFKQLGNLNQGVIDVDVILNEKF